MSIAEGHSIIIAGFARTIPVVNTMGGGCWAPLYQPKFLQTQHGICLILSRCLSSLVRVFDFFIPSGGLLNKFVIANILWWFSPRTVFAIFIWLSATLRAKLMWFSQVTHNLTKLSIGILHSNSDISGLSLRLHFLPLLVKSKCWSRLT